MPAASASQQRLMGQAYALKKGKIKLSDIDSEYREKIKKLADDMTNKQLKDFAETKHSEIKESNLVNHAKKELTLAGMFEDNVDGDETLGKYNNLVANAVIELIETFSKQGHSGFSANMVSSIFSKLVKYETLTSITSNPDEWSEVTEFNDGELMWQNKRNPAYFSKDAGKTWYNVDESVLGYIEATMIGSINESRKPKLYFPTFEEFMVGLNPGQNVMGMGPVKFPGNPDGNTTFHGQMMGSGDTPMFVIDKTKKDDEEEEKKRLKKALKRKTQDEDKASDDE